MLNDATVGNTKFTKGLQILFYLLVVSLSFNAIFTIINSFVVTNYFTEFFSFAVKNVLIFGIVLILTLIITIIPIVLGQHYKNWSEDKQTQIFFKVLTIVSLSLFSLASVFVYIVIYPNYTILQNPFSITDNQFLLALSPVWWYFSYNVGLIVIFLLYIYLES